MIRYRRFLVAALATLAPLLLSCSSTSSTSLSPDLSAIPPSPSSVAPPPAQTTAGRPGLSTLAASTGGATSVYWTHLSCGPRGVLARRSDGTLWGWGSITMGVPYGPSSAVPARIGQDADWLKPASGYGLGNASGAIKADHSLWTWGGNFCGVLGRDVPESGSFDPYGGATFRSYSYEYPPTPVGGYDWADVSFAANHVVAVKIDGTLWAWGNRAYGRLGDNTNVPWNFHDYESNIQRTPIRIGTDNDWVDVQAGSGISIARKSDGTLWEWGDLTHIAPTLVGSPADWWSAYSVGDEFVLAIRQDDGSLWAWGWNEYGQLGTGGTDNATVPVRVAAGPWKAVGAGAYHSLAVKSDGTLWSFGENHAGKLGTGTQTDSLVPVQVGVATDWAAVDAGEEFSAALKDNTADGILWLWGENDSGQLGNGYTGSVAVPTLVDPAQSFSRVRAGSSTTFGIRPDNTLWGWGNNVYGQLGDATGEDRQLPARVGSDADWLAAAPANTHTLALKTDGALWTWGENTYGEVGTGNLVPRYTPARLGSDVYRSIAAAWMASFAVRSDGTLWAWGLDVYNRLGVGNSFSGTDPVSPAMSVPSPRQVGTGNGWKQVSASEVRAAAVKEDGSLWILGSTSSGVPARVGTDGDWDAVATGSYHAMALKRDGSLWGWGSNGAGELGDGTFLKRDAPVRIGTDLWRSVAVRYDLTVAVRQDGTLWGWGGVAQAFPTAPASGSNAPVRIGTGIQWVSVSSSGDGNHWAAVQADGSLYTWGSNWYGQLGNGGAWALAPVMIP